MTSLIDVIFLLLLFFMLSSSFTRFAEVELAAAGAGGPASAARPVFLTLAPTSLRLNGATAAIEGLPKALDGHRDGDTPLPVLVAARPDVTAQRLTDLLVALRALPAIRVTVLEAT
ncbi:biopolymer transporter ExbD [Lutimaribacter sp. EGI FJ00015]|uniref:Biopolymer transporter ExbD n=2 Tax=Lutimaribacter degradans TaxID=2945989 RepID=A0ACC5ZUP9_9RHOB|nr:biopolymer transporter ExbD [Lutimaribacter sp. EGI FJ00013]MCO0612946.1 biopolymer transporter ExbD [Lutimaribacter sp. EGI FJ00015]MCO0635854.1 biopolymer transporter ExbD [Lutimaribacter sp. EGI FJ00014]